MTRDWTFTLTNANTWYNLWSLITQDASWVDNTFTLTPFVPNNVKELQSQNTSATGTIQRSDSKQEAGLVLSSDTIDARRSTSASIDLKNINYKPSVANMTLYVSVTF